MVKQQKVLRDGGGSSKVPAVVIPISGRTRKYGPRKARSRLQVLRMLSQKHSEVDTEGEPGAGTAKGGGGIDNNGAVTPGSFSNGEGSEEFLSTGRTGRRNAMPDILGHHAETGTADLTTRLQALTTETKHDQPGTSGMGQSEASNLQQQQQHMG